MPFQISKEGIFETGMCQKPYLYFNYNTLIKKYKLFFEKACIRLWNAAIFFSNNIV